jgi:uncharacterized membrane protein YjfL (UPF0719 family)
MEEYLLLICFALTLATAGLASDAPWELLWIIGPVGVIAWGISYYRLSRTITLPSHRQNRALLYWAPFNCLLLLAILLVGCGFDPVVSSARFGRYFTLGVIWLHFGYYSTPWFGIFHYEDVVERGNEAAAIAVLGTLMGLMVCTCTACSHPFLEGHDFLIALWAIDLASALWFAFWLVLEASTHISDSITIDRDSAAAWRLIGALLGAALLLGPMVAALLLEGWQSAVVPGVGSAALFGLSWLTEKGLLRRASGFWGDGVLPAFAYVSFAGMILWLGR